MKTTTMVGAAVMLLASSVTSAGIIGISGSAALVPPSNFTTNSLALFSIERIDTTISAPLSLDITQPGTYSDGGVLAPILVNFTPGVLAAGTQVDSYQPATCLTTWALRTLLASQMTSEQ